MKELIEKYNLKINAEDLEKELVEIKAEAASNINKENLKTALGAIDLTSLHTSDTPEFIAKFTDKVNKFKAAYPDYPLPASICVYPNFAKTVRETLKEEGVGITTVSACFPSSQSFLDVKELETRHAMEDGATEIDIVLPHSFFVAGNLEETRKEIAALRKVTEGKTLKVILESGALQTGYPTLQEGIEAIAEASLLALEEGADFIKTSTGKQEPSATPIAALVMCKCLKAFMEKTGKRRGFKPAGGVSSSEDAILYLTIVEHTMGREQLTPKYFRIGASSLANKVLTSLEGTPVKFY
ncbi:MAG: deoxyribose-phosphate aldolase [Bacteroidales bacterium]|nr:deoxyribose-phosphate aldolase [Bacteroidales bacterium]